MALKDVSNATNVAAAAGPGLSASIIGLDHSYVYGTLHGGAVVAAGASPTNLALNTALAAARIGTGTGTVEDSDWAGKALRFEAAAGAVAIDAAVANTYLNRTGKALVANNVALCTAP